MEKANTKEMIGKTIVSEETGRKFGIVGDVAFITESGELMNIVVSDPTTSASNLGLSEDDRGRTLIPFNAVKSVGDFVIVSEKDMV